MKRTNPFSLVLIAVLLSLGMTSCFEEEEPFDAREQYFEDIEIINDYIIDNDLDAYDIDSTGVYISIYHEGTEDTLLHPSRDTSSDTTSQYITIGYKGYLTDGSIFDGTSTEETVEFKLSSLIAGWQIGIPEMTKGDSAKILIPSYWGYQNSNIGTIPANSVLIFDIYLDSFERK